MDYHGDSEGLHRESIPVPFDEMRRLSYLETGNPSDPIACRLAAENPDAVGGLISAGGSLDPDQEEIREAIEELREMSR